MYVPNDIALECQRCGYGYRHRQHDHIKLKEHYYLRICVYTRRNTHLLQIVICYLCYLFIIDINNIVCCVWACIESYCSAVGDNTNDIIVVICTIVRLYLFAGYGVFSILGTDTIEKGKQSIYILKTCFESICRPPLRTQ